MIDGTLNLPKEEWVELTRRFGVEERRTVFWEMKLDKKLIGHMFFVSGRKARVVYLDLTTVGEMIQCEKQFSEEWNLRKD